MKDTELKRQRNRDLYLAYIDALRNCHFDSMAKAVKYVIARPAPHFYISASEASNLIGCILSGRSLCLSHLHSRRRIWYLYCEYKEYLKANPDCKLNRERILEILVDRPAPEFYLTMDRAKHIIIEEQKRVRKKIGEMV